LVAVPNFAGCNNKEGGTGSMEGREFLNTESEKLKSTGERKMQGNHLAEKHFSVAELSERWNLSADSVRRLFEDEPGVVVFKKSQPYKRVYRTLRIPESVAMRVYRRSTVVKG
jgi:hypothetical protein